MPITADVWLIHPKLAVETGWINICDRVEIDDSDGLNASINQFRNLNLNKKRVIWRTAEKWWGGNWPDVPLGGDYIEDGELEGFEIAETSRSSGDDYEFIIYPPGWTLEMASAIISPEQVP